MYPRENWNLSKCVNFHLSSSNRLKDTRGPKFTLGALCPQTFLGEKFYTGTQHLTEAKNTAFDSS